MAEFARVLSPGGRCVIHHPGTPTFAQRSQGGRSELTTELFAHLARANGLEVLSQVDSWGPGKRSNTKLFADCISTLAKPRGRDAVRIAASPTQPRRQAGCNPRTALFKERPT